MLLVGKCFWVTIFIFIYNFIYKFYIKFKKEEKSEERKKRVGVVLLILAVLGFICWQCRQTLCQRQVCLLTQIPYGPTSIADNQSEVTAMLKAEWEDWKSKRITSNGAGGYKRVQRDASTNYDTVSEGMGYGLLLAVCFNEQALFDDLYVT